MQRIFDGALRGCEVVIGRCAGHEKPEHSVAMTVYFVGDDDAAANVAPLMLVRIAFPESGGVHGAK